MFIVKVLIIAVLSFISTLFFPWYSVVIVAFLIGFLFSNRAGNNFLAGLLGVGLFWLGYAFYLDYKNQHILSSKIAMLFSESLKTDITSGVLLMITAFLGAILGGLSCMAGAMIMDDGSRVKSRKAIKNKHYSLKLN